LSNLHHQTANASTNTPILENFCLSPFLTSPITNKSIASELGVLSIPMKLSSSSSSSLTTTILNSGNLTNKLNKISSNQQDSSSLNFNSRLETNQESTPISSEKKTFIVRYFSKFKFNLNFFLL
jgi:hypothetical protein